MIEYIYHKIYYYNNKRIHTSLKTSPAKFKQLFFQKKKALLVQDFYPLTLRTKTIYTIPDNFTAYSNLVLEALEEAVIYYPIPEIMHSDQGSEYLSKVYTNTLKNLNILISNSDKGSPWQNGYVESYFGKFKEEFGDINKFNSLGEVIEYIYQKIYYYNNHRIHTTLKMPPVKFKQLFFQKKKALLV